MPIRTLKKLIQDISQRGLSVFIGYRPFKYFYLGLAQKIKKIDFLLNKIV
jgi:hypothetical protein